MTKSLRLAVLALRSCDWLTAERARLYGFVISLTAVGLLVAFYGQILGAALHHPLARPIASDFDTFWAGARLALQGNAAGAYNDAALRDAESVGAQLSAGQWYVYLYPPTFLLLSLPLGWLPYLVALPVFVLLFFLSWAGCMRVLLPPPWPLLPVLAFPVGLLNAVVGQNGYASATCFGISLLLLQRWPLGAGAALGMLAFKPHLAIAVPLVLIAARRWTPLVACATTSVGFVALSWIVLGTSVWRHFLASSALAGAMLQSGEVWPKLMSVYAGARLLHASPPLSFAAQAAAAVAALTAAVYVGLRRPGGGAEIAAMAPAAMLCTPYVWDYDLVCLSIPMAWLAQAGLTLGWRAWEKTILAALYVTTAFGRLINLNLGFPLMPCLVAALLLLIVRRGSLAA